MIDCGRCSVVSPGDCHGSASRNLNAGSRRCEFDIGEGGGCQSGQRRQDLEAHCLCIVFLRRAVLRGPTGGTVGGAAADGRGSRCDGRLWYGYEGGSGEEECDCPVVEKSQQYGKGNKYESRHGCDKALAIRRPRSASLQAADLRQPHP